MFVQLQNAQGHKVMTMASSTFSITPDDDEVLAERAFGIRVVGAGTVHYLGVDENEDTVELPEFGELPVVMVKVFATGTTATGIKGYR